MRMAWLGAELRAGTAVVCVEVLGGRVRPQQEAGGEGRELGWGAEWQSGGGCVGTRRVCSGAGSGSAQ